MTIKLIATYLKDRDNMGKDRDPGTVTIMRNAVLSASMRAATA